MGWNVLRMILGGLAGVFAVLLLGLPLWRFSQGRLPFVDAVGFWIAGAGFAVLGVAAITGEPDVAQQLVMVGVVLAAAGSVVQQMLGNGGRS